MKKHIQGLAALAVVVSMGVAQAATFTVTTTAASGAGSFTQAILDADASADPAPIIAFNIAGAGPHYIAPPVGGFPLLTKDNTTIDGYSQPGSSVNTKPITATNNAAIKIVLDTRTSPNFRDMAYVGYGSVSVSSPVINNSVMYGDGTNRERGGYDPSAWDPYEPGEVAILGIYRATNVTIQGLALLGDGSGNEYAIAVAQDYGLDPAVNDRFAYPQGTSKGLHIAGCWIGVDPGTGAEHPSGAAIASFRHRDKGTGGTRPELPNMENFSIGVKPGSVNPRAQFNVLNALGLTIAGEGIRCTVAGNQFFGASPEIGRYDDTQVPSIVFGTDGDGVNDGEEGNLLPAVTAAFYTTANKVFVFAGNIFGLARDGSRPNAGVFAVDEFNFSAQTKVRFGSDFDGINDALEANTLYDTLGFAVNANAPTNTAWISMRGNSLINNTALPMDETTGLNTYNKFIADPITPVITAANTKSLTGSAGAPIEGVVSLAVDVYAADPEGDAATTPQGKTYLGSFTDNSAADSNPAVGAFTFNTTGLGLSSGTKVTITANYVKADGGVQTSPFATSATVTAGPGTFTVTTTAASGAGSFTQAILDADASADPAPIIAFNIAGAGPHYIAPPVGGFPLLTKDNTTIDGYSQPGSSVNTKPITATNNAAIKIVLDTRTSPNFRDMAYVGYGSVSVSSPVINNSVMYGDGTNRERGGYDPSAWDPYEPGEVAILGIYRATNVTIQGLALLGDGSGNEYAIAVAQDYGLDPAVNDRFAYPQGTSKGLHIAGCWIGVDPGTGAEHPSGAAIASFRHRDKGTGGTRPELPNMENFSIGVKPGSVNPRAQFNVLNALGLTIAGEGIRCTVAGNQFFGASPEIGRYDDTQVPSIVFGTDGDGVNDGEEGNLLPAVTAAFYTTANKVFVFAGNIFGLARDGSRPNAGVFAVDEFNFSAQTKVRFGSDFDGINDALEANTLYDTLGFAVNANAPTNTAWISMRGNSLINNTALPMDETTGLNTYNKFIADPITPVITAANKISLTGSAGVPLPGVGTLVVDVYAADPEGDAATTPQGKTYLGSFTDNSAADSNPAVGAFTFNTTGLGLSSGTKVTITANYLTSAAPPTIASIARSGGNTTLTFSGGAAPYSVVRSSTVTGAFTDFTTAVGSPAVFADAAAISFYRVGSAGGAGGGQTSPFALSATVP